MLRPYEISRLLGFSVERTSGVSLLVVVDDGGNGWVNSRADNWKVTVFISVVGSFVNENGLISVFGSLSGWMVVLVGLCIK